MDINHIPTHILYAVRERMGATSEHDTTYDEKISRMSPELLVRKYCGWHLGDEEWASRIIDIYKDLMAILEMEG